MTQEKNNQEKTRKIEMEVVEEQMPVLADILQVAGDFLKKYADILSGRETEFRAPEPVKAEAMRPVVADKTKALLEKLKAYKGDTAGDYPESKKPVNRQEEMAEEGKVPDDLLLWKGGGGTLARGEVYAVMGEPKQGKTALASIFAAVAMDAEFGNLRAAEKGVRVMYFDTEQEKRDTCNVKARVHTLCGWDKKKDTQRFRCYSLGAGDESEKQCELICNAIRAWKPDLAVIDDVTDLCSFWEASACRGLFAQLKKLAEECNCAILVTVPECAHDDMWERLGDTAERHCAEIFQVRRDDGVFRCSLRPYNDSPLEIFSFTREGELGMPTIRSVSDAGEVLPL